MNITSPLLCAFGLLLLAQPGRAPAAASNTWVTVFDERFADNPSSRFKPLPVPVPGATSSGASMRYDEEHKAYSVAGYLSLVRPVRAGAQASLDLRLRFDPPETNAPAEMVTAFKFVLFDRSVAGVEIVRSNEPKVPVRVRFVQETTAQSKPRILRELELENAKLDGEWQLGYRHGLLTLRQDSRALGGADTGVLGAQVAGVTWTQKGGTVTCQRMTLNGAPIQETSPAEQATLKQASSLNETAQRLFREGKPAEALPEMQAASALFVQVHGEDHYDSANSFANLAAMQATNAPTEAIKLQTKALAIHEATLGPTHAHTTLTRFNLGKLCFDQGAKTRAKELWTRCRDDWEAVLGAEYSLVKTLNTLLPRL